MKRFLVFILGLLSFVVSAQATQGTPTTYIRNTGGFKADSVFVAPVNKTDVSQNGIGLKGRLRLNSITNKFQYHNGTAWVTPGDSGVTSVTGNTASGITVANGSTTPYIDIQQASSTQRGTAKLYTTTGANTDGGIDQNYFTTTVSGKANLSGGNTWTGTQTGLAVATHTLGTSSTSVANMADIQNAVSALNLNVVYKKSDGPSSYVTGVTTPMIVKSYLIPANTFQTGTATLLGQFEIPTTAPNTQMRCYINTTNAISGAQVISLSSTSTSTTGRVFRYERNLSIVSSSSTSATMYFMSTSSPGFFITNTTQDPSNITIDPSLPQYLFLSLIHI